MLLLLHVDDILHFVVVVNVVVVYDGLLVLLMVVVLDDDRFLDVVVVVDDDPFLVVVVVNTVHMEFFSSGQHISFLCSVTWPGSLCSVKNEEFSPSLGI